VPLNALEFLIIVGVIANAAVSERGFGPSPTKGETWTGPFGELNRTGRVALSLQLLPPHTGPKGPQSSS
jgi:hypothetical protein